MLQVHILGCSAALQNHAGIFKSCEQSTSTDGSRRCSGTEGIHLQIVCQKLPRISCGHFHSHEASAV